MSSSDWLACGPYSDSWIPNPGFGPLDGGDDLRLIGQTGANGLVQAEPDVALDVARHVASEIPGGCGRIHVFDCNVVPEADAIRLLDLHLRRGSLALVDAGVFLLRECQTLSVEAQASLAELLGQRRRAEPCVRVLASTSVALYERVQARRFHAVLYYMLNTVSLSGDVLELRRRRLPPSRPLLITYCAEELGS